MAVISDAHHAGVPISPECVHGFTTFTETGLVHFVFLLGQICKFNVMYCMIIHKGPVISGTKTTKLP